MPINPGIHSLNLSRGCSGIIAVLRGSCVGAQPARWISWLAAHASRNSACTSTDGECLPFRSRNELASEESPALGAQAFFVSAGLLSVHCCLRDEQLACFAAAGCSYVLFQMELSIPFIPLFVVPYLSIDLFFVAAPFICRGRRELRTFSLRIVTAIAVAGICFVLVPLRCAFTPVPLGGWLGNLFGAFLALDRP